MTCEKCKNRDLVTKTLQVVTWAIYLAPIAYSAYKVLKDNGVIDKASEAVKPYAETAGEYAHGAYDTVKTKATEVYSNIMNKTQEVKNSKSVSKEKDGNS